jgi:hypothetical protein
MGRKAFSGGPLTDRSVRNEGKAMNLIVSRRGRIRHRQQAHGRFRGLRPDPAQTWGAFGTGRTRRSRSLVVLFAATACLLGVGGLDAAQASGSTMSMVSFTSAGCSNWTVPAGVSSVAISAVGAAGVSAETSGGTGDGVSATLSVTSGETLDVCVDYGGGSNPVARPLTGGGRRA